MNPHFSQLLSEILLCLKKMKINCEEKNWEAFYENENSRTELMEKLKKMDADASQDDMVTIKAVIELNKELTCLAQTNKDAAEKALLDIKRNIKKTSLYQ